MTYINAEQDTPIEESLSLTLDDLTDGVQDQIKKFIMDTYDALEDKKQQIKRSWKSAASTVLSTTHVFDQNEFTALTPLHVQVHNTLLGHFWSRSLQTPSMLFNVLGLDNKSQNYAPLYKSNLVDFLNRDKFQVKMNNFLELDSVPKGVTIAKVEYREKYEEKIIPQHLVYSLNMNDIEEMESAFDGSMIRYKTKVYDGPTIRRVDPYDFVFEYHDDWDAAFKCERRFVKYEDLADVKVGGKPVYRNLKGLNNLRHIASAGKAVESLEPSGRGRPVEVHAKGYDSQGRIELLCFYGDIAVKMPDGSEEYLRNYQAVVAGRSNLIQFCPNEYMFNPFVKWEYRKTEDGWGESILLSTMKLVMKSAEQMNLSCEAAKLGIQPPMMAPEGMFGTQTKVNLQPGTIVKYQKGSFDPQERPQPIPINPNAAFEHIQYFESQVEATTGATRQMSGNMTTTDRDQTATEYQGLQMVGNLILDRVVDLFNLEFKLPIIEKFATLLGYFNPVERSVMTSSQSGSSKLQKIPQEAYFGQYHFTLEDSKSELERKGLVKERMGFIMQLFQDPQLAAQLKKVDLVKSVFADLGYGDPDALFLSPEEQAQEQKDQMAAQGGQPGQPMQPNPVALHQQNAEEAQLMPPANGGVNGPGLSGTM